MSEIKTSVLIVDDVTFNHKLISNLLESHGFGVIVAETGEEAVECCRERSVDVVLMDVNLPGISGVEATKQIRDMIEWGSSIDSLGPNSLGLNSVDPNSVDPNSVDPNSPALSKPTSVSTPPLIIGLSAHAGSRDRESFLAAGMDECLSKPIDLKQLIGLINRMLVSRSVDNDSGEISEEAFVGAGRIPDKDTREDVGDATSIDPAILDVRGTLKRIGDNTTLFWQFVEVFREDVPEMVVGAEVAARANDLGQLGNAAHRIRGIAANLGAAALSESARQLEVACQSSDSTVISEKFVDVKEQLHLLNLELAKHE
ncbi:MAG: response regulator [Mariniblastus sp.]